MEITDENVQTIPNTSKGSCCPIEGCPEAPMSLVNSLLYLHLKTIALPSHVA